VIFAQRSNFPLGYSILCVSFSYIQDGAVWGLCFVDQMLLLLTICLYKWVIVFDIFLIWLSSWRILLLSRLQLCWRHAYSKYSLRKQPTFREVATWALAKRRLSNKRRNSILMTCTTQILVVLLIGGAAREFSFSQYVEFECLRCFLCVKTKL